MGGVLVTLLAGSVLAPAASAAKAPKKPKEAAGGVGIEGVILDEEGKAAGGAVLTAVHLESSKIYHAEPASSSGSFRLTGIPYGYYQIAVAEGGTLHAATVPVNIGPASNLKLDIILLASKPVSEGGSEESVTLPILGESATAGAQIKGLDRKSFFKTKAGIATVIGGSAMLLLLATH